MKVTHSITSGGHPLYAVFSKTGNCCPGDSSDLLLKPCPAMMVKVLPDGRTEVLGLIAAEWEIREPEGPDFLGYACSMEQAIESFLSVGIIGFAAD